MGKSNKRSIANKTQRLAPYFFLLPFFAMFIAFQVGPIARGIIMSLQDIKAATVPPEFVRLKNYASLLTNARFYQSLKVTVLYTLGHGSLHLILALILALILDLELKGRNVYRMIFFLPVVTSLAVSALIWRLILDDEIGLLNVALRTIGFLGENAWLRDPKLALPSIIVVGSWRWFGFELVILLAGLQNIPQELYDAAKVDGAKTMQRIWYVTLPMLFPVLFFAMTITLIGSLMLFEEPFILTNGGPRDSTLSMAMYLYQSGFSYFKLGYAAAIGYVMTLFIIGVAFLQIKLLGRRAGMSS